MICAIKVNPQVIFSWSILFGYLNLYPILGVPPYIKTLIVAITYPPLDAGYLFTKN